MPINNELLQTLSAVLTVRYLLKFPKLVTNVMSEEKTEYDKEVKIANKVKICKIELKKKFIFS